MTNKRLYVCGLLILICACDYNTEAKKIHNRQYKFTLTIPGQMVEITDKKDTLEGKVFYDAAADVFMIVSEREGKYKSVDQYIDCETEGLEKQMRIYFDDQDLKLIDCRKPSVYPKKITVLHFKVSILPAGFDTYMIYFIHHRKKDIQISFTYKYASEEKSLSDVNSIMQTLKLK